MADDGGDEAGQTHGAEVDVLAAEALGLLQAVEMRPGALLGGQVGQLAHFAVGAAVAALLEDRAVGIRHRAAQPRRAGKGPRTFLGEGAVKIGQALRHEKDSFVG